jgi:hypothetical protein
MVRLMITRMSRKHAREARTDAHVHGYSHRAVEEDVSLREARQRMKDEARRRVEQELEQRKLAEDEVS